MIGYSDEQVSARRSRALMVCTGPVKYKGQAQIKSELDTLKAALAQSGAVEACRDQHLQLLLVNAGIPLLGLTFSLPGHGRIGFFVIAAVVVAFEETRL